MPAAGPFSNAPEYHALFDEILLLQLDPSQYQLEVHLNTLNLYL